MNFELFPDTFDFKEKKIKGDGFLEALIMAGGTILAGAIGAGSTKRAAQTQAQAASQQAEADIEAARLNVQAQREAQERAIEFAGEQEFRAREDIAPWRQAGVSALDELQRRVALGPGEFRPEEDPGYQYGYEMLVRDPLMAQASARGRLRSGATLDELQRRAQEYAGTKYENFLNRYYESLRPLQSLAGIGQTAAGQLGTQAMGLGRTGAGLLQQYTPLPARDVSSAQSVRAAEELALGNIYSGTVGGLTNVLGSYLQNRPPGTQDYVKSPMQVATTY
jgi:hypothetical protein